MEPSPGFSSTATPTSLVFMNANSAMVDRVVAGLHAGTFKVRCIKLDTPLDRPLNLADAASVPSMQEEIIARAWGPVSGGEQPDHAHEDEAPQTAERTTLGGQVSASQQGATSKSSRLVPMTLQQLSLPFTTGLASSCSRGPHMSAMSWDTSRQNKWETTWCDKVAVSLALLDFVQTFVSTPEIVQTSHAHPLSPSSNLNSIK
jgi:hypothetical protein